jgi:very-short-patch-repair endonuclease
MDGRGPRRGGRGGPQPYECRGALEIPAADPRTRPRHHRRRSSTKERPGLRLHRSRTLAPSAVTARHGIAVTTPARTIEDIRNTVEPYLFRRALRQAELAGFRVPHLSAVRRTRSDLELLFLALCADHDLPRPLVNHRLHGYRVDFFFAEYRLAVETDSWEYHQGSVAMEDDHARDLELRSYGIETRRYTGDQIEGTPEAVVADLRRIFDGRI